MNKIIYDADGEYDELLAVDCRQQVSFAVTQNALHQLSWSSIRFGYQLLFYSITRFGKTIKKF